MPSEVMEIQGRSGSGKTEFLYNALLACVLPREFEGIKLQGRDASVALFDLDYRFDLYRFNQRLVARVKQLLASQRLDTAGVEASGWMTALQELAFKRIYVFQCQTLTDVDTSLSLLRKMIVEGLETQDPPPAKPSVSMHVDYNAATGALGGGGAGDDSRNSDGGGGGGGGDVEGGGGRGGGGGGGDDNWGREGDALHLPPRRRPPGIQLLLIDNTASFFWQLKAQNRQRWHDSFASSVRALADEHALSVIATTPMLFKNAATSFGSSLLGRTWDALVSHVMVLEAEATGRRVAGEEQQAEALRRREFSASIVLNQHSGTLRREWRVKYSIDESGMRRSTTTRA